MEKSLKISREVIVCLLLTAIVLAVYWPVRHFDFVACDDNIYVTENHHVREGLSGQNIVWAFTTADTTNWHPLTWLSLLVDSSLYGLYAGGYHLTNVFLHLTNSILIFFLLRRMTGTTVRSGFVAALFAIHPINVESVAWVAERKNVLSTFFWFTTMWAYAVYAAHPDWRRYLIVILLFAAGLMAKPMLITLPVVLLLMDYWPLRRFSAEATDKRSNVPHEVNSRSKWRVALCLIREKIPLLLLSVISASVTLYIADMGGAVRSLSAFPLEGRIANALVSYTEYLEKMTWPFELTFFYPWRKFISPAQIIFSVSLMTGVTAFVLRGAKRRPYLLVGWLWYILTLVPVIGIVQVGHQAMADRYAYVPMIGIFMIVAWGGYDLLSRYFNRQGILLFLLLAVIIAFMAVSLNQVRHWQSSETVFRRGLQTTEDNHLAEQGMGHVSLLRGDYEQAAAHFREALRIRPDYTDASLNLGIVFMKQGLFKEAIDQYRGLLEKNPHDVRALNHLGVALACVGERKEAISLFLEALQLDPAYREAKDNLARAEDDLEKSVRRQQRSQQMHLPLDKRQ
jgi:tetratricopeptide (TPR) repeat protein